MTVKRIGRVVLILVIAVGFGCGTDSTISSSPSGRPEPSRADLVDVPVPSGMQGHSVRPRPSEAMERALLTLEQVLIQIPWPAFLPARSDRPNPDSRIEPVDPDVSVVPLAAQHAYLAGRRAWRERQNFQATRWVLRDQCDTSIILVVYDSEADRSCGFDPCHCRGVRLWHRFNDLIESFRPPRTVTCGFGGRTCSQRNAGSLRQTATQRSDGESASDIGAGSHSDSVAPARTSFGTNWRSA